MTRLRSLPPNRPKPEKGRIAVALPHTACINVTKYDDN